MKNAETKLFDWILPNPIIVSSGPFSNSSHSIKNLLSYGVGAVVTKTISSENTANHGIFQYKNQIYNQEGYSSNSIDKWATYLDDLAGMKVIANIAANSPSNLSKLAKFSVEHKVEIIELGLSCPTFGYDPICFNISDLELFCKAARKSVDIPLIAKIMLTTSREYNRQMVKCIKSAGIDAVAISDSLPAFLINNDDKIKFAKSGGLSGPYLKPLVLKCLLDTYDINLKTIGIGGIENVTDIVDYLEMDVEAIEICSFMIKNKASSISTLVHDFQSYLTLNNTSVNKIRKNSFLKDGDK